MDKLVYFTFILIQIALPLSSAYPKGDFRDLPELPPEPAKKTPAVDSDLEIIPPKKPPTTIESIGPIGAFVPDIIPAGSIVNGIRNFGNKFYNRLTNPDINIEEVWKGNFTSLKSPNPPLLLNVIKSSALFKPDPTPDFSYEAWTTTTGPTTPSTTEEPDEDSDEDDENQDAETKAKSDLKLKNN